MWIMIGIVHGIYFWGECVFTKIDDRRVGLKVAIALIAVLVLPFHALGGPTPIIYERLTK